MFSNHTKVIWFFLVAITYLSGTGSTIASAQQAKKPFTVSDEIGLTLFNTPGNGQTELHFSPDGNYFAVWSERGVLELNCVEDSLVFYRSQAVENFLEHSGESPPSPVWVVNHSYKEAWDGGGSRPIRNWRWLADSSGVAFLEQMEGNNQRLVLADLRKKTIEPLTSATEATEEFDIRDRHHYVYTVANLAPLQEKRRDERRTPFTVGTGRSVFEL